MEQVVLKPKNLSSLQPIFILCHEDIMLIEALDQDLKTIISQAYQDIDPEDPVAIISWMIMNGDCHSRQYSLSDYSLDNRCLYYHGKLYLPNQESLRLQILQKSHNQPMTRHPGVARTYEILQCSYYWLKMVNSVRQYIRNCHTCSRAKPAKNRQGELLPFPVPSQPWKDLAMDFITELPVSTDAYYPFSCHIWVITDCLTKERYFVPCQDMTASHLARMFTQFVIQTHGLLSSTVSDCGTQFTSELWRFLCQQLGITVKLSTAHHPETNGQTKRANEELERYLRSHVNYLQDDWAQWLPLAEFAANNAVSESSRMTPFFANKGFYPRLSLDLSQQTNNQEAQDLAQHMNNIIKQLKANLLTLQEA